MPEAKLTLQSRAMGPAKVMIPFFKTSVPILSTPNAFVFLSLEIIRVTSLADMNLKLKPLEKTESYESPFRLAVTDGALSL